MRALVAAGRKAGLSSDYIASSIDRRVRRYLERTGQRGQGNRNNTAFVIAVWMLNDFELTDQVAWAYLVEWNDRNDPPLSERELRSVFTSAKRGGARPPRMRSGPGS